MLRFLLALSCSIILLAAFVGYQDSRPAALMGGDYTLLGPRVDFAAGAGTGTIRTPSGPGRAGTLLGISARDVQQPPPPIRAPVVQPAVRPTPTKVPFGLPTRP